MYLLSFEMMLYIIILFHCMCQAHKLYKDPWGEKIFTNDHGTGANALSGTGAGAGTVVTATLASHDDDRVYALEKKLRQVELELRMYKVRVCLTTFNDYPRKKH